MDTVALRNEEIRAFAKFTARCVRGRRKHMGIRYAQYPHHNTPTPSNFARLSLYACTQKDLRALREALRKEKTKKGLYLATFYSVQYHAKHDI